MTKMLKLITVFLTCLISFPLMAQEIPVALGTPQKEIDAAINFLDKIALEERSPYVRFFSTYTILPERRDGVVSVLSFICHSLTGKSAFNNYAKVSPFLTLGEDDTYVSSQRVPGSDTLWYLDIRDFNWTIDAWDEISSKDGYFIEPIVSSHSGLIVRADWFIYHVTDINSKNGFYNTLLYASSLAPNTQDEWRKYWGLDVEKSRIIGNEYGVLVTSSMNRDIKNNRMLFGYRTELGYLYETYDVKNQDGKRDYFEGLFLNDRPGGPPDVSDFGLMMSTNQFGLPVYGARYKDGGITDFSNIDMPHLKKEHSCINCHLNGPLATSNILTEFVKSGSEIYSPYKEHTSRISRNLLNNRFEDSIITNQSQYEKAVKRISGINNVPQYYDGAIYNYGQPVDIDTAASECGVSVEEFNNKIMNHDYSFGGRLRLLSSTGESIPRSIWETNGADGIPGAFQQAMIIINELDITPIEEEEEEIGDIPIGNVAEPKKVESLKKEPPKEDVLPILPLPMRWK